MTSPWDADLQVALALADRADAISLARFRARDLVVETKPDLTPVTDADRAVERAVRDHLRDVRPDDAVVGEEYGADPGTGGRRWIVDPIDGTKNFVRGVPVWATLVALADAAAGTGDTGDAGDPDDTDNTDDTDDTVVGVVSAPALGRRWWAARGGGAWTAGPGGPPRALHVSGVARLEDASLSFSSLSGWRDTGRLDAFLALTDRIWRHRGYGDFWSYVLVAEGAVDLAAEPELSLWDMAAVVPVLREAGGRFTDLDGVPGPYGSNAAASNGRLHDALLAALRP